jgi:hypothetical protein
MEGVASAPYSQTMGGNLENAFPTCVRGPVQRVVARLPVSPFDLGTFAVRVDGEELQIPQRIYPEPPVDVAASFEGLERDVFACLYTRHHDGYVRQRHLRTIINLTHSWVAPFVVQLVGEYVVEILVDIQAGLSDLDRVGSDQHAQYGRFARDNAAFIDLTAQRATSYWNCYYRQHFPNRADYPGFALIESLKRAAANHA